MLTLLLFGQKALSQRFKNEFGFKTENDSYLAQGSDRYYTNGLFIYFRQAANQESLGRNLEKRIFELSAGQQIFNPISGYAPDPRKHDRPFAGYLHAGGSISWLYKTESVLKAKVELGTVGPNALGRDGQELLHNTIGFYEISGWDYQIRNEVALNISGQYLQLLHRADNLKTDFSFEGDANIGTTFTGLGAGIIFRAGRLNQLFNSGYTNAAIGHNEQTAALVDREFFFYAKPQLRYIAYDATIQGSLFRDNSPVTFDTKPVVFTQQIGFNYSSRRFTFDFSAIFKTREIKSSAKAHQYGSASLYYRFN